MAAQSERVVPDAGESNVRPIEFITENGFGIFRSWEINGDVPPTWGPYDFLVECPDRSRQNIFVEIADQLVVQIEIHTSGRITLSNTFWICCAEQHLATYIGEHNECPRDGRLCVEALTPSDLNLSIRWERT